MNARILCVDDDLCVLAGFRRNLRDAFAVDTAENAAQALGLLDTQGPYAVVVSDLRMPGMDGIQFLAEVRRRAPQSARIMLTGNSDQRSAVNAVNEGNIFRFLCKPCPPEVLVQAINAGVEQHRLVTAERELLEKTLRGSIKVMTDVLALVNPLAFGRAQRVRRAAKRIAAQMGIPASWQIEVAAMLSQLGLLGLPPDTLEKLFAGQPLSDDEQRMFLSHPGIGRDWVANIPRLTEIAEIMAYQEKRFDGGGVPQDDRQGTAIPLGARILKVAIDFDACTLRGLTWRVALERLRQHAAWYDPEVLAALHAVAGVEANYDVRTVSVAELSSTMIIDEDVRTVAGLLVVSKGQDATRSLRERLRNFAKHSPIREPIRVLVRPQPPRISGGVPAAAETPRRVPYDAHHNAGG